MLELVKSTVEGFNCVERVYAGGIIDSEDSRDLFIFYPKRYIYVKDKRFENKDTKTYWLYSYNSIKAIQDVEIFKKSLDEIKAKTIGYKIKFEDILQSTRLLLGMYLSVEQRYTSV